MLFFDIDGTLITTDGKRTFPESAKRALREARERGHLVYINTGRVMENVDDFIREVGFDGYVCGCGTYIVSEGGSDAASPYPARNAAARSRISAGNVT